MAGLLQWLKEHAKNAIVSATSTHGGTAAGHGGRKPRKKGDDADR